MRRFSIKYSFTQALRGIVRNGVMSFASVAVLMSCLVVIGAFALLVVNINLNLDSLGNLTQIVVFADADLGEGEIADLGRQISSIGGVDDVQHITKDEALAEMKAQAGANADAYNYVTDENNPLSDEFVIYYSDVSKVVDIEYALNHIEGIEKINNRADLASSLDSFRNGVILIFIWFLIVLIVVTLFIIVNTIKLSVYARRHEITVMRYVGATGAFITTPFVIEGVLIGVVAAVIAYFIEVYAYYYIEQKVITDLQMLSIMSFSDAWFYVLGGFLLLGIGAGITGSMMSLRKYLRA